MTVLTCDPVFSVYRHDSPSVADRLAAQLIENYAKRKPAAGQKALFTETPESNKKWREELHPREGDGKFTDKTGGGEGVTPSGEKQKDLFGEESKPVEGKEIEKKPATSDEKAKQEMLFHGLKDNPGQRDLFNLDRIAEQMHAAQGKPKEKRETHPLDPSLVWDKKIEAWDLKDRPNKPAITREVPEGLDPVAWKNGQQAALFMGRKPKEVNLKPGTLPYKSWLDGYDKAIAAKNSKKDNGKPNATKSEQAEKKLPPRTADTMSDAIALSSPNGRQSKRSKEAATKKLDEALFGKGGATREQITGVDEVDASKEKARKVAHLRGLALIAPKSQAKKLIAQADALENSIEKFARSLSTQLHERYRRQSIVIHTANQLTERYAKQFDESKINRDENGEFAAKVSEKAKPTKDLFHTFSTIDAKSGGYNFVDLKNLIAAGHTEAEIRQAVKDRKLRFNVGESRGSDANRVTFNNGKPIGSPDFEQWNSVSRVKENYSRGAMVDRMTRQLIEQYARIKPASNQSSLFNEEDHPRNEDGEFAKKSEGAEKQSDDKILDSVARVDTMKEAHKTPQISEVKEHAMKVKKLEELDLVLADFHNRNVAVDSLEFWEKWKDVNVKRLLREFKEGRLNDDGTEKEKAKLVPQKAIELPTSKTDEPNPGPSAAKRLTKTDERRRELIANLANLGLNATETTSTNDKPLLVLRGDTKPIRQIIKDAGGTYSAKKGDKDDPRWLIEGPRRIQNSLRHLPATVRRKSKALKPNRRKPTKPAREHQARESIKAKEKADREAQWAKERADRIAERQKETMVRQMAEHQDKQARIKEGWTISGNTYPVKDKLRSMGGTWDANGQQWIMPSAEATAKARKLMGQSADTEKEPEGGVIHLSEGSGYGGQQYQPGAIIRNPKYKPGGEQPEWLKVLSSSSRYVREDGMSFGVGNESGYIYSTKARAATAEEFAPTVARREATANRRQATADLAKLPYDEIIKNAVPVEKEEGKPYAKWPEGDEVMIGSGVSRSSYVITPDYVWFLRYNGADGDDWAYNNLPGYIASKAPATPELVDMIHRLKSASEEPKEGHAMT